MAWLEHIEFDRIHRLRTVLGVTVNDVIVTLLAEVLSKLAEARNIKQYKSFQVLLPVSLRDNVPVKCMLCHQLT